LHQTVARAEEPLPRVQKSCIEQASERPKQRIWLFLYLMVCLEHMELIRMEEKKV